MYPVQPLVDDLIALLQKYPDVTPTQIMILKSAAAYLTPWTMTTAGALTESKKTGTHGCC